MTMRGLHKCRKIHNFYYFIYKANSVDLECPGRNPYCFVFNCLFYVCESMCFAG